jgi:hypothetical protein
MEATLVTGAGAGFLKWLICLISRKIANAMIKKVKNGVKEETVIKSSPVEQATEPACDHAQAQGAPARMSWARLLKRVFNIDIDLIDLRSPQEMPALYPRHCGRASADQIRKA